MQATCELALEILNAGAADPFVKSGAPDPNIARDVVGPIDTTFVASAFRVGGLGRFPAVMGIIRPLLRSGGTEVDRV